MVINASVNENNYLHSHLHWIRKAYAMIDLFGIQVVASVNVINHMILVDI